uniref:Holin n=1 Tax=candidate division WOR-3 bacterium TaxID=2052148 RepID=A0A7C4YHG8_UNCW3
MQKFFLIFAISLVIERALEQISEFIPKKKRKKIMWLLSTFISLLITFIGKIGILGEMGIIRETSNFMLYIDYFLTGLIISSGAEPVHSLIISLESKKEELKKKVNKD